MGARRTHAAVQTGRPTSLADRIAGHAATTPEQLAVVDAQSRLTFAELDRRAEAIAAAIDAVHLAPDSCVGLLFQRSADFIAAALAVWKAGCAYVPLDSATPAERTATILTDADCRLLLTHTAVAPTAPAGAWAIVDTSAIKNDGASRPRHPIETDRSEDRLAYVAYTSGSTGVPNGVEITHRNVESLVAWHETAFRVTAADRASHVAGLGFDAAGWEIWPHLAAGASVHIADELTRRSADALREWLLAERISVAFVPTALAELLFVAPWPDDVALRLLLTGGDALSRRPPAGLPFAVINNYGPTECTVVSTSGPVEPAADGDLADAPSIGQPIHQAEVFILNEALASVPDGEPGELCVAGPLVGRRYRNRPILTASRFVTYTPQAGDPILVYRTGDRARRLPTGELVFLGRIDEQIKIRGYRIEPGEIAAVLNTCPLVAASVVTKVDGPAGPALAAYVLPARGAQPTAWHLADYLSARLPAHMIPSQFVPMTAWPLTANGKVDRARLPGPSTANRLPDRAPTGRRSDDALTAEIGALVAKLLARPTVEPDDNIFMIGGHSMLGAQLVALLRDRFGVPITLRQLFAAPTVEALAGEVAALLGEDLADACASRPA